MRNKGICAESSRAMAKIYKKKLGGLLVLCNFAAPAFVCGVKDDPAVHWESRNFGCDFLAAVRCIIRGKEKGRKHRRLPCTVPNVAGSEMAELGLGMDGGGVFGSELRGQKPFAVYGTASV